MHATDDRDPAGAGPARRRLLAGLLAGGAGTLLGACASAPGAAGPHPRPMLLVHGAWYGGWCWERLTPHLERRGVDVIAPTLRGIAHRSAEGDARRVTLESHADELAALMRTLDLRDVVLVGHSYGGMVISLVAERERARIAQLIYLDAFVPEDGMALVDYLQPPERRQAIVKTGSETGFVPPVPTRVLGVVNPDDLAYVEARVTPQPFGTTAQKVALRRPAGEGLPRAYVACVEPASGSFGQFASRIEGDPSWRYRTLRTGHNAMIVAPGLLAETLLELAAPTAAGVAVTHAPRRAAGHVGRGAARG
jgi:pimeloyl-ACP methyl ester carboxylesterase